MPDLVVAARAFVTLPEARNLTVRQLALLGIVVDEDGPHHVRHLAAKLGVTKPVITRAVQKLGAKGLVERRLQATDDRRDCVVAPTVAGRFLRAALAAEDR